MDELARAQAEIARALGRDGALEERGLADELRAGAEPLARAVAAVVRLARVHAAENRAFDAPVEELVRALAGLVDRIGAVRLVLVDEDAYVNDVRVRADARGLGGRELAGELRRHGAGGLAFHAPLAPAQVQALVAALSSEPASSGPRRALAARLAASGAGTIEPLGLYRLRTTTADEAARPAPEAVVGRLLALVSDAWEAAADGRAPNALPLRRAVLDALDAGLPLPAFWAPFRDAPAHVAHALEVAFVAMLTARGAGLSFAFQQDLALAALLHDVGQRPDAPGDAPPAPDALERHALEGARVLLRQRGFHAAKLRRALAVLEHHRDHASPRPPSPAGAILRLAEDYANVVRVYRARVPRGDVLAAMLRAAGTLYHPALAQVLVNVLGRFPPGELVELEDGRRARVAAPPDRPERWALPVVQLVGADPRSPEGPLLDLADGPAIRRALPGG